MKRFPRTTLAATVAGAATFALVLTGCSAGAGTEQSTDGKVKLTVATFNEFGYEDLFSEYEDANPNVTITHKKSATTNEARDNLTTRLAAGSGLSDVEAIEVDWLPELLQYSDQFIDLSSDDVKGRWLDWKSEAATDADGRLIAYGTDIGPEAVCYRSDLFAAAGLPTDRAEVAALLGTSWESYYAAGDKFTGAGTNVPWFDSAGATWQGVVNQIPNAYEENDGTIIATENPEVKEAYTSVLAASSTLSSRLGQWSDDWTASFQNDGFATQLCPGWMLGVISGNAEGVTGWDIADTFPGGGGNWGGSYLTVPEQSKNQVEAQKLAAWLTAPEQQLKAFASKGTFPSQVDALESDELLGATNEFFNNAPTGEILANRAAAVDVTPYKGEFYFAINDAMQQALTRVEEGTMTADESWDRWVADVKALG
ncbi:cellobiose-binding protein [Cryobacterium psychrophilum]|uniref:Carbohydrate ABC transporter substrate-binding protein n=1 Tax=Cryobacterium psychrophilum TaxID=41988 RepID=A0A4Y8KPH6_9MICO|nr:ABC transporter substrate-binding protein [Cryobacterium psychrophilum]TDW31067.1 cellobiose-binding protein [Cryobacterium psychrophilum]TFD78632.1 carbohydrate ABC transporter substrate-binding protein [Cryobacterium psychrophilum]